MKWRCLNNYRVLQIFTWTLFSFTVALWIFYGCFGHSLINLLYNGKPLWLANKIMGGRAITPVENYYAELERTLWVITLWVFPVFLVLIAIVTKPLGIIISLITVVVFLVISEFAVRFFFRDITTTTDNSSYFAGRWQKTVLENSWGFREREFDLKKPAGVYRIAVIGDSNTYGQGINVEDRFTDLVEKQLASQNGKHKYEVLNFGRPGTETFDQVEILINSVLHVSPDFILLQWYTNDVEGRDKSGRPSPLRLIPFDFLFSRVYGTSALFYLLNEQWITLQWKLNWLQSYEDYMLERFHNPNSPSSLAAKAELRKFITICKEKRIPLGIVLLHDHAALNFLPERMLEVCQQETISCLDLRNTFAQNKTDTANRLDSHPGPLANRLVADRLMETFGEIWSR